LYLPVTLSFTFFSAALELAVSFKSSFSSAADFLTLALVSLPIFSEYFLSDALQIHP
jgi:hypothetical protein